MDDKLKIFWNLEVLVKMSRSKNDGPSLRIEELEIENKIKNYRQEIEEIESISDDENYDTSAEMADRNIEIITKKQIQVLRNELKEKNREITEQKNEEKTLYEKTNLLRENINSQEKYIISMQERVGELVDIEILDRYNGLIAETTEKVNTLKDELEEESDTYNEVQESIIKLTEKITQIEETIAKKKNLLQETQAHLENKENYIDHTKTEKNARRIKDLENKIDKLTARLEIIRKDPQYLESKIKDIINNKGSNKKTKPFLVELINQVIRVPYINVPTDNMLEEELLRATQARDSFANDIDQKTYNILEADTPEKLRIEFLSERIKKWKEQLEVHKSRIAEIDHDEQYNYERKERILSVMINSMKNDVIEFERAYEDVPDTNIGAKASIKAALEEKKEDLIEAEKIATLFRKDEAEDIAHATRIIKYECDQINKNIIQANDEIQKITNRLTSKKSGLIDISTRNKDKDILKELAQIVIDIKHRRQFPETPLEIIERLEEDLDINLKQSIDMEIIEETSELIPKNYEEYYTKNSYNIDEIDNNYNNINDEVYYTNEINDNASINNFEETYNRLIKGENSEESAAETTNINYNPDEYQEYSEFDDQDGTTYVYEGEYNPEDGEYYTDEYPEGEYEYEYYEDDANNQYVTEDPEYNSEEEIAPQETPEPPEESKNDLEIAETETPLEADTTPEESSEEDIISKNISNFYTDNNLISDNSELNNENFSNQIADQIPNETTIEDSELSYIESSIDDFMNNNENNASEEKQINSSIEQSAAEQSLDQTPLDINEGQSLTEQIENNPENPLLEDNSAFQPYEGDLSFETIDNNLTPMTTDAMFAPSNNNIVSEATPTEESLAINNQVDNTNSFERSSIETTSEELTSPEVLENDVLQEPFIAQPMIDPEIETLNDTAGDFSYPNEEFNAEAIIDSLIDNSSPKEPVEVQNQSQNIEEPTNIPEQSTIDTLNQAELINQDNIVPLENNTLIQPTEEPIELTPETQTIIEQPPVVSSNEEPNINSLEIQPSIENINTTIANSDNIYSNEQIENELDNYISSLENQES